MKQGAIPICLSIALAIAGTLIARGFNGKHSYPVPTSTPVPTIASQQPNPAPPSKTVGLDHIVLIMEENHGYDQIVGNKSAPYLNRLATQYAIASSYFTTNHPSLPNYLVLTSGTNAGITNDCNPPSSSCQANVPSIANQVEQSGRTRKAYMESMPAPCGISNAGDYATKHDPFVYYPGIRGNGNRCTQHVVPFTQLGADLASTSILPNYVFISPNLCSDMHNCSIAKGDAWLAQQVPAILSSSAFTQQRSLLIITADESEGGGNNHVATILAGSAVTPRCTATSRYTLQPPPYY